MSADHRLPDETEGASPGREEFEQESQVADRGFFGDLIDFLIHHAAWWLTPIVLILLALGALLLLGGSAMAPFIYPLF